MDVSQKYMSRLVKVFNLVRIENKIVHGGGGGAQRARIPSPPQKVYKTPQMLVHQNVFG